MVGELYVKDKLDADVKPATVTTIADAAPVPFGATQVNDVWLAITETDVHCLPPTVTETRFAVAAVPKLVPLTVMPNPPDVGLLPELGRKAVTRGAS